MTRVHYLPPVFDRRPWLGRLGQVIEARMLANLASRLRKQSLEKARATARGTFARLGPRTRLHGDLIANLAMLHPSATTDQLESRADRTWGWVGVTFAEIVHARDLVADVGQLVDYDIDPQVDHLLRTPGRAAVLASAHVGPWLLCNLIAARHSFPLTTTVPSSSNPGIDRLMQDLLRAMPVSKVGLEEGYEPLAAEIVRGHKVFLAVDGWNDEGHSVAMFGEQMRLDPTAALLAVRQNVPLIPISAMRLPKGRYRIVARRALQPDASIGSETERARRLTEAFAKDFERWIRAVPGQWLCLTPRWAEETVWNALTRVNERTELPADRTQQLSEDELDEELTQRGLVRQPDANA